MDNGHGEMEAHVMNILKAHTSESVSIDALDFTNKYSSELTEYFINGKKFLINKELENEQFEFRLSNDEGEITTVKNDATGKFVFPVQVFEEAKDYIFYVDEINGGSTIKGITYDSAKYTVTIPVRDDGVGNLYVDEANIKYDKHKDGKTESTSALSFTNNYILQTDTPNTQNSPNSPSKPELSSPNIPQTGDNTNLHLWFALLFVSGGGFFGTALYNKKKKN